MPEPGRARKGFANGHQFPSPAFSKCSAIFGEALRHCAPPRRCPLPYPCRGLAMGFMLLIFSPPYVVAGYLRIAG